MKAIALAIALSLSLAGCASAPITPANLEVPILQGDTSLDAAYHVAATAYLNQLPTMPASVKASVKPIMINFYAAIVAADKAQALGDANTLQAKIGAAMDLYRQLKPVLHLP